MSSFVNSWLGFAAGLATCELFVWVHGRRPPEMVYWIGVASVSVLYSILLDAGIF